MLLYFLCGQVEWNTHSIYARKGSGQIGGKPDKLFYLPAEFDTENFGRKYSKEEVLPVILQFEEDEVEQDDVDDSFVKVVNMVHKDWKEPQNVVEGLQLFMNIVRKLENFY